MATSRREIRSLTFTSDRVNQYRETNKTLAARLVIIASIQVSNVAAVNIVAASFTWPSNGADNSSRTRARISNAPIGNIPVMEMSNSDRDYLYLDTLRFSLQHVRSLVSRADKKRAVLF